MFHLARAGWLRWYDELPKTVIGRASRPIALRVRLDDGSGFDLTEAGTKKSLAVYVVRDPAEVPGIARLGPDPTAPDFSLDDFAEILAGRRTQVKGLLRDQSVFAGVGNAYSDEILHNARDVALRARRASSTPTTSNGCTTRCATPSSDAIARRPAGDGPTN